MTAIAPRKADLEGVSELSREVINQFRRDARRGCRVAGPSRAHRVRLLRAGDDPLRARELQGFRFRAAARPGAACSYAMQEQALGGLSARTGRLLCGPEPSPVRRRRQRAARLTPPVTGDLAWK